MIRVSRKPRVILACVLLACPLLVGAGTSAWGDDDSSLGPAQGSDAKTYEFSYVGGSLGEALAYLQGVTGLQYLYADPDIARIRVGALTGRKTLQAALREVMASTGVSETFSDTGMVIILRDQVRPKEPAGEFTARGDGISTDAVEEIQVTAVRTTALGFHKISPTVVLEGDIFLQQAGGNIVDMLYAMPALTASRSAENTVYLSYGNGVNMLDLRDMGVVRTLVTVNGRRFIPTNGGEPDFIAVDSNMIPAELIDRVEILTSGASVLYGADAVAGLVNIILKDDFEGGYSRLSGGLSGAGGKEVFRAASLWGSSYAEGRGHYTLYASYQNTTGLKARDRDVSRDPAGFAQDGLPSAPGEGADLIAGFGYAPNSASGTVTGYGVLDHAFRNFDDRRQYAVDEAGQAVEDYRGTPDQRYNFASVADLISPNDTLLFTANSTYDVADHHRVTLEFSLGRSTIEQEIAPSPLDVASGQGLFLRLEYPFLPADIKQISLEQGGADVAGVYLNRRLVEVGNRRSYTKRTLVRSVVGLAGDIAAEWAYSLFYQYGQNQSDERGENAVDISKVAISVSPEKCASTPRCQLTNYFGTGSITGEQADFIRTRYTNRNKNAHHILSGMIEGRLGAWSAGPILVKGGVQYRHETTAAHPDQKIRASLIAGTGASVVASGTLDIVEVYGAVNLPLLTDVPLADRLSVDAGLRYSSVGASKGTVSWQIGFEHSPTEGMEIRGAYQVAHRNPNISELYTGAVDRQFHYVDPCNGGGQNVAAQNCTSDHALGRVEGHFNQQSNFVDGQYAGNRFLNEERAKTENLGFTLDSRLWGGGGGLSLSVDWFNIRVRDYIRFQSLQYILNACYVSRNFENPACGVNVATGAPFFRRDAVTHEIQSPGLSLLNSGMFHASGIDVDMQGRWLAADMGLHRLPGYFGLRVFYSYNIQSRYTSSLDGVSEDLRGQVSRPVHKAVAEIDYQTDRLKLIWRAKMRGQAYASKFYDAAVAGNLAPAISYHDFVVDYEVRPGIRLQAGVNNLFDAPPPRLAFNPANSFPEYYDIVGRRFFIGLSARY